MKKKLMAMTLLAATAAFGEIWTITVPDGETKYLQAEVEALIAEKGHGFAGGDVVEKEGGGRLVGTNTWKSANSSAAPSSRSSTARRSASTAGPATGLRFATARRSS